MHGGLDVLENGALDERVRVFALEGVALDVVPVVVGHVDGGAAAELGRAAAGVVDVVVLEGDGVAFTGQVDAPVVVGVAVGGPAGTAVDWGVFVRVCGCVGLARWDLLKWLEMVTPSLPALPVTMCWRPTREVFIDGQL